MTSDIPPDVTPDELRVLLLAPTSRDAQAILRLLTGAGIVCAAFATMTALCEAVVAGAGAAIVSEESLAAHSDELAACVANQPVWSDLPVIVLSRSGREQPSLTALLPRLGNVSVLERPVRLTTFVSIVRSALRARKRQYEVRAHIIEQEKAEEELRGSEERLRLAVQTGKLGIWELDLQSEQMNCSAGCKASFGLPPAARFDYTDFWAAVHPDDRERLRAAVRASVAQGVEFDIEYRNVWPDGSTHWVLARGHPSYTTDRTPLRMIGVTLDITERKSIEERRNALLETEREARAAAERAGKMKDEFLATLSHELRTPLNAIVGWAQILKSASATPQDIAEGIDIIERNARAQTQIIEDLLDMSRIISGKIRLNVRPVDLAAAIGSAVKTVAPAAEVRGVRLQVTLNSSAHPVSGDPVRIHQIFWNLLSNAIKFCHKGDRVSIVLECVQSSVQVTVSDTGEGIDPQFLPYVFDRFRQADATTTRRHGGLGLGLAIVKQLVELHGGTIRAQSLGKGQGATFIVALPLTAVRMQSEPEARSVPVAPEEISASFDPPVQIAGLRVLVVDDEPDARALLRRVFEECRAQVFTASSSAEALRLVESQRPDVIVSDVGMPGEDGYSFIRRVRALPLERGRDTPAIALTAYARAEDRLNAQTAGFQHHISKPVAPSELLGAVATLVNRTPAA